MNNNFAFIFTVSVALFTALSGLITSAISAYFQYKTTKINCDTMLHRIDNEYNHQNSVKSFDIIYKNKLDAYKNICSHITYMKQNESSYNKYLDVYNEALLFADENSRKILKELNNYIWSKNSNASYDPTIEKILEKLTISFAKDLELTLDQLRKSMRQQ